jgi:hypothetical protein
LYSALDDVTDAEVVKDSSQEKTLEGHDPKAARLGSQRLIEVFRRRKQEVQEQRHAPESETGRHNRDCGLFLTAANASLL